MSAIVNLQVDGPFSFFDCCRNVGLMNIFGYSFPLISFKELRFEALVVVIRSVSVG